MPNPFHSCQEIPFSVWNECLHERLGIEATKVLPQRNTKRTKNINHAGLSPQWRRQKSNAHITFSKLRVDFVNNLLTFLLSIMGDLTTSCYRGRPHPNSPKWLSQTLPTLDHCSSFGDMSHILCGLLTFILWVRNHIRF